MDSGLGNFNPPAALAPPNFGNNAYAQAYPYTGLASLLEGLTKGVTLGSEMNMKREQLKNEADYRNAMLGIKAPLTQSEIEKNKAETSAIPQKLTQAAKAEADRDANAKAALAAKDKVKDKKSDEAMDSAAGAYMAMDNYMNLAKGFAPQKSGLGAAAMAPIEWMQSKVQQTSPANNLADKSGEAATLFATAINKSGGGRMTEAEIHNMAKAMGGNAIGETLDNLGSKHEQMKNELAAKIGKSRQEIEAYMAAKAASGGGGGGGSSPEATHNFDNGSQAHRVNGQWLSADGNYKWDGKAWLPNK